MITISRTGKAVAVATAVLALATACGSSSGASASPAAPASPSSVPSVAPSAAGTTLQVVNDPTLGQIVADGTGHTLYRFDKDSAHPPTSNCSGSCATIWPPEAAPAGQVTATGVDPALVGTITRADGTRQLTLDGWPLYRFASDTAPGDTKGQGVGGSWFASTPTGGKAMATAGHAASMSPGPSSAGGYGAY
ncbi:hypothetical protein ACIGXM_10765 [Kitasatospora sp. NPDC052896]|uniref:hypothetical protein n=1 Tax=Kitasatospora sp. NPDC052896 TaxID=3364061 RepID=UPI0037CAE23C